MNISWFKDEDIKEFPNSALALLEPDGLLAAGGNLSVKTLTNAYSKGIFPWFEDGQPILWWCPSQRAIIDTNEIHVSKNMKKLIRQKKYTVKIDTNFSEVVRQCKSAMTNRQRTWITSEMETAYIRMFDEGLAHSIEIYRDNKMVGGLYGVFISNCFCGESMFSREPNTSKLALIELAVILKKNDCGIIDCQLPTQHLSSMGAKTISREEFLEQIKKSEPNIKQINWTKT